MLNFLRAVSLLAFLCLLACSSSSESPEAETGPKTVSTDQDTGVEVEDNRLAIEPGLYVIDGANCDDPANTGLRVWTGRGLEGSTTTGCTFEVTSRDGMEYIGRQSCTNNGDNSTATTELSIEILEPGSIVLTEGEETTHLTLCPGGQVPEWVQEKLMVQ